MGLVLLCLVVGFGCYVLGHVFGSRGWRESYLHEQKLRTTAEVDVKKLKAQIRVLDDKVVEQAKALAVLKKVA